MNSRLDHIKDWEGVAKANRYSTRRIAKECGISTRQLERFFKQKFNQGPRQWLHKARMAAAIALLAKGFLIKEIAGELGYRTVAHFSHDFKTCYGIAPTKRRSNWERDTE